MKKKYLPVVYLFLATLVTYVLLWKGMDHLRNHNGPWIVHFASTPDNKATLTINNHKKGVTNAVITISGIPETPLTDTTVEFDDVSKEVPFGKFIYHDLMFLPGVVALHVHGHEIQLVPRTLFINKEEVPWSPAPNIELIASTNAPPVEYTNVPEPKVQGAVSPAE